jgi:tricarballylate dehydrogenase
MSLDKIDVVVIGSGNAALCAGIAALEKGASVLIIEKADQQEWGGNSRYTAGAMRFAYDSFDDLKPLLKNPEDEKIAISDFGAYPKEKFLADLLHFNEGKPLSDLQHFLVEQSLSVMQWLASHQIKFDPIYSRQTFKKDGKYIFWGGLSLEAEGEGNGLVHEELKEFLSMGGQIKYNCEADTLKFENDKIVGVNCIENQMPLTIWCNAVVLACGGFESNKALRIKHLGPKWEHAKVRGTRHNMGKGLELATAAGGALNGFFGGCHATPMDLNMPEYGNLDIPHIERKHYRKISYLFGIMLNARGERFVDEGLDFRNYTYAQFGKAVLEQPDSLAWQIFDAKVMDLLYSEYKTADASYVEANSVEELVGLLTGVNPANALATIQDYNAAIDTSIGFDPTTKDGRTTQGLALNKTNWANLLDTPPFRAYPVTGGITFTYGGVKVDKTAQVLTENNVPVTGLFAAGEMVGGVFFYGYPGGSGLTSGAIFGRSAGHSAAEFVAKIND